MTGYEGMDVGGSRYITDIHGYPWFSADFGWTGY